MEVFSSYACLGNMLGLMIQNRTPRFHKSRLRSLFVVMVLFSAMLEGNQEDSQNNTGSLLIPLGSYLRHVNLANIFVSGNFLLYSASDFITKDGITEFIDAPAKFPLDCWRNGLDIDLHAPGLASFVFMCNETHKYPKPVNVADFLYTHLIPGGYLTNQCGYMLKTRELIDGEWQSFLYTTCSQKTYLSPLRRGVPYKIRIMPSREDRVGLSDGKGSFATHQQMAKKIIYGSYLNSGCDIGLTDYSVEKDQLTTVCYTGSESIPYTLNKTASCVEQSLDITFDEAGLTCQPGTLASTVHTASYYLPAGNYHISCAHSAYYPCLGENNRGMLVTRCLRNPTGPKGSQVRLEVTATLDDSDDLCQMNSVGYISNFDSVLRCDPTFRMEQEYPTQAADIAADFTCNPTNITTIRTPFMTEGTTSITRNTNSPTNNSNVESIMLGIFIPATVISAVAVFVFALHATGTLKSCREIFYYW